MAADEKTRCREPSPESPNKRPKPEDPLYLSPQINEESKSSTSKIDDVCGICLLEVFSQDCCVSRGCLDSCDHFFCFVCIMEWAKIDSKCPICKRRFSVIRRPPKPPVFPTERIVQVPVRDQVYNGIGNVSTGPFDRYSDSKCSVCQGKEDDGLLLLCDLCDIASHTYCVGLGANVPDGDWFCPDCALLKAEQAKNDQMESDCCNPIVSKNSTDSKSDNVSIFDIVQGPSGQSRDSMTRLYSTIRTGSDTRAQVRVVQGRDERDVRTLQRCRNVNRRIQVLRGNMALNIGIPSVSSTRPQSSMQDAEQNTSNVRQQHLQCLRDNWNNIRAGSLGFSDNVDNARTVHAKIDVGAHSHQPTSTSNSCQQSKSKKGPIVGTTGAGSSDIDKAWKMMKFAKSLEQRKNSTSQVSKVCSPKVPEVWPVNDASTSQGKQNSCQNIAEVDKTHRDTRPETKNGHTDLSQNVTIRVPDSLRMHEAMQYGLEVCSKGNSADKIRSKVSYTGSSGGGMSVCSSSSVQPAQTVQKSILANFEQSTLTTRSLVSMKTKETCDAKSEIKSLYGHDVCRKANSADKFWSKVPYTGSSVRDMSVSSSSSVHTAAQTVQESNHADLEQSTSTTRSLVSMKTKETCDVKSEIKSLVKLNLKILTKKKKLEVDAFKDIARLATHSILAACGLEIAKPGISRFNNCVCHHPGDVQIRRSTLMPNSCRECFYNFVQNVVNIIMSERIGSNDNNKAAFPILDH